MDPDALPRRARPPALARALLAGWLATVAASVLAAPRWISVDLGAQKFLLAATTRLTVVEDRADALARELVDAPGHAVLPVPPEGLRRLDAESRLAGATSRVSVWLGRGSHALLQRERVDSRRDGHYALTRILVAGSFEWRRRGDARTRHEAPSAWPLRRAVFRPLAGATAATDPLGLLLLAGELVLGTERSLAATVRADAAVLPVTLQREGSDSLAVAHRRVRGGREWHSDRLTRCERVRVIVAPGVADFRLLGLAGDLSLCMDAASGAPLRVSGRDPRLGELQIDAQRIELVE